MTNSRNDMEELHTAAQTTMSDPWAVDMAMSKLFEVRSCLYDPAANTNENTVTDLIVAEYVALKSVTDVKAMTLEAVMEKFALLSFELSRAPVPRAVRLLATSLCCDVEDLLNT
ncbi:hypothetical protein [Labrenzia sp. PHM005]|uniref:hypothetical protein n=1 Tax=Labrenzia sp. PHM005 TaxID=2590016 RepID=UPI0011403814|nr:hypothetical protein [Labrenzia sp. PHM005]QDG77705.1 hypothetical protein FJ695_18575 [Labrenzia sp. PHM005]